MGRGRGRLARRRQNMRWAGARWRASHRRPAPTPRSAPAPCGRHALMLQFPAPLAAPAPGCAACAQQRRTPSSARSAHLDAVEHGGVGTPRAHAGKVALHALQRLVHALHLAGTRGGGSAQGRRRWGGKVWCTLVDAHDPTARRKSRSRAAGGCVVTPSPQPLAALRTESNTASNSTHRVLLNGDVHLCRRHHRRCRRPPRHQPAAQARRAMAQWRLRGFPCTRRPSAGDAGRPAKSPAHCSPQAPAAGQRARRPEAAAEMDASRRRCCCGLGGGPSCDRDLAAEREGRHAVACSELALGRVAVIERRACGRPLPWVSSTSSAGGGAPWRAVAARRGQGIQWEESRWEAEKQES